MKVRIALKEPSKKKPATATERKRKSREKKLKALSAEELVELRRNESQRIGHNTGFLFKF